MSCEGGIVRFIINSIRRKDRKRRELYLPPEIITEILSWLPMKSVERFKCVCRLWCSIAEDSQIIHKHTVRATDRIWVVEEGKGHLLKHTCQGLIFEPTGSKSNYQIRNPSTNRFLALPDIDEKDAFGMKLCYISSQRTFKVICPYPNGKSMSFKILTVDVDDEWRAFHLPSPSCNIIPKNPYYSAVVNSFKGAVYVLVILHKTKLKRRIVILGVKNESVWTISIRRQGLSSNWSKRISLMYRDRIKRSMGKCKTEKIEK